MLKIYSFILFILLSACSRVKINVANLLAYYQGQTVYKDIQYAELDRQQLNIYTPTKNSSQLKPVIIFFYGGGWETGSKDDYRFVAEPFVSNNYIVVIPDYAKYPEFKYPSFVEDGAKATSWVYKNIEQYGGDPENIIFIGHSAGAHIAGLLATDSCYLEKLLVPKDSVRGFVGIAGAYDFIPVKKSYVEVFSPVADNLASAMPATYFTNPQLPVLLAHSRNDEVIELSNIISMQKQAKLHKLNLEVKFYDTLDHIGTIAVFSMPFRSKSSLVKDVITFCDQQTKGKILFQ